MEFGNSEIRKLEFFPFRQMRRETVAVGLVTAHHYITHGQFFLKSSIETRRRTLSLSLLALLADALGRDFLTFRRTTDDSDNGATRHGYRHGYRYRYRTNPRYKANSTRHKYNNARKAMGIADERTIDEGNKYD